MFSLLEPRGGQLAVAAFVALAAGLAVLASLERVLGRPIPRFAHSRAVGKNRLFLLAPAGMILAFTAVLIGLSRLLRCSHCADPYGPATIDEAVQMFIVSTAAGGVAGWVIYAAIAVSEGVVAGLRRVNFLMSGGKPV